MWRHNGRFVGSRLGGVIERQPFRRVGFRFGYVDNKSKPHLLITKR
mgnify:CR=1 FL=1